MYVTPFPSYLKLSFKKPSQYLRNKEEFLINNYDKNSNTFNGKAQTLFNNLPYQIRSRSSFKSFSREVKKYLLDQAQAKYFSTSLVNRLNLICYSNFFNSSCSLVTWKILFHFHSLLIYFSIYIVTSKGFSQFCNSHANSIPLAYAGSLLNAIPSLLDIYTNDAHSIHFQFCSLIALPSLLEQCYILMQYLFVFTHLI